MPGSGGRGRSARAGPMPKIPILGNALPNEEDVPLRVEEYFAGNDGSAPPTVDEEFRKDAAGINMEFDVD